MISVLICSSHMCPFLFMTKAHYCCALFLKIYLLGLVTSNVPCFHVAGTEMYTSYKT